MRTFTDVVATLTGHRRRQGLPQIHLASRMGCRQPFVSELETGRSVPSIAMLYTWAAALEVEIAIVLIDAKTGQPLKQPSAIVPARFSPADYAAG